MQIEVPTLLVDGKRAIASDESLGPFWREAERVSRLDL
jgi:hypothetical protein